MTSLAISAYVKWKPVARLTLLLIFIALPAVGQVINIVLRTDWGNLLNLLDMTAIIATRMFGIENPFKVPLPAALTAIVAFCSFCIFLLSRKVRAYEVVKS